MALFDFIIAPEIGSPRYLYLGGIYQLVLERPVLKTAYSQNHIENSENIINGNR